MENRNLPTARIHYIPMKEFKIRPPKILKSKAIQILNVVLISSIIFVIPVLLLGISILFSTILIFIIAVIVLIKMAINPTPLQVKNLEVYPNRVAFYYNKGKKNEVIRRKQINRLDFEVDLNGEKPKLTFLHHELILESIEELPIIMDGITEVLDFEYFDTSRLNKNIEMLNYKPKYTANPRSLSFIRIEDNHDKVIFVDIINSNSRLIIDKTNQNLLAYGKAYERYSAGFFADEIINIENITVKLTSKRSHVLRVDVKFKDGTNFLVFKMVIKKEDKLIAFYDADKLYEKLCNIIELKKVKIRKELIS